MRSSKRFFSFLLSAVFLVTLSFAPGLLQTPAYAASNPYLDGKPDPAWLGGGDDLVETFVSRDGGKLMLDGSEYRFMSVNVPTLTMVEDISWHTPTKWEQEDALKTVQQMNGKVARTYVFSVAGANDYPGQKRHVYGPTDKRKAPAGIALYTFKGRQYAFDEDMFKALDQAIALCHKYGVRLIVPFVDMYHWWGGISDYEAFEGKSQNSFWSDPAVIQDFEATISYVLNRTNTVSGVKYKNDPAILAWETVNEGVSSSASWTPAIAAFIKSLDTNHLVVDGSYGIVDAALSDRNVDIVSDHYYPDDRGTDFALRYNRDMDKIEKASSKKAFIVGEYGFETPAQLQKLYDAIMERGSSGAMLWSLRYHNESGGFYPHTEGTYGGVFYQAYKWPGSPSGDSFGEKDTLNLIRTYSYKMDGVNTPPPVPAPNAAPVMKPIGSVSAITWQGVAGAAYYSVERASSLDKGGDWKTVAEKVYDGDVSGTQLFDDTTAVTGKTYYYRVKAYNGSGSSGYSNTRSTKAAGHKIIDDQRNLSKMYEYTSGLENYGGNSPKYSGDANVLKAAAAGQYVAYALPQPSAMLGFSVETYSGASDSSFKISVSSDGSTYKQLTGTGLAAAVAAAGSASVQKKTVYSSDSKKSSLLQNAKYLKIEYPSASAAIGKVEIDYSADGSPLTFPGPKVKAYMADGFLNDPLNNLNYMYDHTPSLGFEIGDDNNYFFGDTSRLLRHSHDGSEYITYKADGDMNCFTLVEYAKYDGGNHIPDMSVYTSADGKSFTPCTDFVKAEAPSAGGGWWYKATYTGYTLPKGTRYLKIVYPKTADDWNPSIGNVQIGIGNSKYEIPADNRKNPVIDSYEGYSGMNSNLNKVYTSNTWGAPLDLTLDPGHKNDGSYGMKFAIDYGKFPRNTDNKEKQSWGGFDIYFASEPDWSGSTGIQFWADMNGQKNSIKLQFNEDSGEQWYTDVNNLSGSGLVKVPFSSFTSSSGKDGKLDLSKIKSFGMYINKADSDQAVYYFDSLSLYKLPEIDRFENYSGDSAKLNAAYTFNPDGSHKAKITLDGSNKNDGDYGLKLDYDFSDAGWLAEIKVLGGADWSGKNGIQLWVKPDGRNCGLTLQIKEHSGEYWKAPVTLKGTSGYLLYVPFSAFYSPTDAWNKGDRKLDLSSIDEFDLCLDKGSSNTGTIYFDSITAANTHTIDNFEVYQSDSARLAKTYVAEDSIPDKSNPVPFTWAAPVKVSLDTDQKNDGSCSLRLDYTFKAGKDSKGKAFPTYGGVRLDTRDADWNLGNAIQFWYKPDGNSRGISIQFKDKKGQYWKASTTIAGKKAQLVTFPLSAFSVSFGKTDGKMDLSDIKEFGIFIDTGSGKAGSGTLYFDSIQVVSIPAIDDFDSYSYNDLVAAGVYTPNQWGNTWKMKLDSKNRDAGKYGCAITYAESSDRAFAGATKLLNHEDWSGYNGIHLWLKPDNSKNRFVIQLRESSNECWETYVNLEGTKPILLTLPFSSFRHQPGSTGNNVLDLNDMTEFSLYINKDKGAYTTSTIYVDSITLAKLPVIDNFDYYYDFNENLKSNYTSNQYGDPITVSLDAANAHDGKYSMKYSYDLTKNGWGGTQLQTLNADWSGYAGISLWVKPTGTGHGLKFQFKETGGDTWELELPALKGSDWTKVFLPFSDFKVPVDSGGKPQSWAFKDGLLNLGSIEDIAIYADPGTGTKGPGTFYIDTIELAKGNNKG